MPSTIFLVFLFAYQLTNPAIVPHALLSFLKIQVPRDYRVTNKTDVGGRRGKEWSYDRDSWTTIVYGPKRPLPKTGF